MASKVTLHINNPDVTVELRSFSYDFAKNIGTNGMINSAVQGGVLNCEVITDGDLSILHATIQLKDPIDGNVTLFQLDGEQKLKDIAFSGAHIVSYREAFTDYGTMPMVESFRIVAQKLDFKSGVSDGGEAHFVAPNWKDRNDK